MRPPRPDERTGRGVAHTYDVYGPNGDRVQLRGIFCGAVHAAGWTPCLRDGTALTMLDPRAVVTRDGLVIYAPRRDRPHDPATAAWLRAHPEWPRVALDTVDRRPP
jgi:hypothetical protein